MTNKLEEIREKNRLEILNAYYKGLISEEAKERMLRFAESQYLVFKELKNK